MREDLKKTFSELREKKSKGETLDRSEQSLLETLEELEASEQLLETKTSDFNEKVNGLQSGLDSVRTKVSDQEQIIKDLKEKAGQQNPGDKGKQTTDEEAKKKLAQMKVDADALQAELMGTDEGQKLLFDAWNNMDSESQKKMGNDDEFRLSVYQFAKSQLPEQEPKPPWATSDGQSHDEPEDDIAKFFGKKKPARQAPGQRKSSTGKEKGEEGKVPDPMYSEDDLVIDHRTK